MKPKIPMNPPALHIIARIRTDFPTKFGLPRQSGLIESLSAEIVFEPAYRNPDALRGMEGFTHLWLIWGFSGVQSGDWSPMVRPPRLGGNTRMGVFATRSPFRPNALGLSCVRLTRIELENPNGPVLHVAGADMMDGSPIFDIKPYLPYTDSRPEAKGGFTEENRREPLTVNFPERWLAMIPHELREGLCAVLAEDPRPAYQDDPARIYGFNFAGLDVRFSVLDRVLTVREVASLQPSQG